MKAKEILKCLCYMGEDSELFNIVEITEETEDERQQFCEDFFGKRTSNYLESGEYFYYWTNERLGVLENGRERYIPDNFILTGEYSSDGIPMAVNFYKIDD